MSKIIALVVCVLLIEIYAVSAHSQFEKLVKNVIKGIDLAEENNKQDVDKTVEVALREIMKAGLLKEIPVNKTKLSLEDVALNKLDLNQGDVTVNNSVCSCQGYNCGCCLHLKWDTIKLDDTVCVNFTYLPKDYGIALIVSVDDKVYYRKEISARNPPAICIAVPHLEKYASICVRFTDLDITNHTFSGCVYLSATLAGAEVEKVKLGCFKIPPQDGAMNSTMGMDGGPYGQPAYDREHIKTNSLYEPEPTLRLKPRN